jgi:hypothetical protein
VVGIFVNLNGVFNLRRLHTGSGLQDSDVIISDAPHGNFTEISSSSYELSLFLGRLAPAALLVWVLCQRGPQVGA